MKRARTNISLKRAYDEPTQSDGVRILVERLWPRGVTKEKAAVDHWLKDVAPSPELRRWYNHQPERWAKFQERYRAELDANSETVQMLRNICESAPVTFVFAARDTERNGAVALKNYLESNIPRSG